MMVAEQLEAAMRQSVEVLSSAALSSSVTGCQPQSRRLSRLKWQSLRAVASEVA